MNPNFNPPPIARQFHILLTEDNRINQQLAIHILENAGHTVELAINGRQAVDLLSERHFDAVLMDVQMPEMNGFDATLLIRQHEQLTGRHTPIIAMTANAMKGDRDRCFAAGMDAYISKPVNIEALLQTIQDLIPATELPDAHLVLKKPEKSETGIDIPAFFAIADVDIDLAQDLVTIFCEDSPGVLSDIHNAIARNDCKAFERAAHTLKSMLGYFSDRLVNDAALQLQAIGLKGDLTRAPEVLNELERSLDRLKPFLTSFISGKEI